MSRASFEDSRLPVSAVLERIVDEIDSEYITLRDLMNRMGEQGLLLLCGLLSLPFMFPVSIPGVSTVFGAGIILIAYAITINRMPWVPNFVADRRLDTQKLTAALQRGIGVLRRVDNFLKPRLQMLTDGALVNRVNGLALMLCGLLLIMPLGLIPFSNTLPAVAILMLSCGISQRDGILIILGYVAMAATILYFAALASLAYAAGKPLLGG
ncbi:MAG: exopolysaccharide biosynthesis protein [Porticoccaceae bacterium]